MSSETCREIVYAQLALESKVPWVVTQRYEEFARFIDSETSRFNGVQTELIRESFSDMIAILRQGYLEKK